VAAAGGERFKVALIVRGDLGWGGGMLGAMCASVLLALFKKLYKARDPLLSIWVRAPLGAGGRMMGGMGHAQLVLKMPGAYMTVMEHGQLVGMLAAL
jgi:peptidyl-tRNA hydrolase